MNKEIECVAKKWGSSLGIIIPHDIVQEQNIKPEEKIRVVIKKTPLAEELWELGPLSKTESTQKIKDELRSGW